MLMFDINDSFIFKETPEKKENPENIVFNFEKEEP
jgi:hypothetical protein